MGKVTTCEIEYREAREEDLDALATAAVEYEKIVAPRPGPGFSVGTFLQDCRACMKSRNGLLLLAMGPAGILGGIMGVVLSSPRDSDVLLAVEIRWFVFPGARGSGVGEELRIRFEAWGKASGAKFAMMGCHNEHRRESMLKFYQKKGYSFCEMNVIKEL